MERVQVKGVYYKRVRYSDIPGCDVKTDLVCPFCDLKTPECNVVCGEGCVLKKEGSKEELYICENEYNCLISDCDLGTPDAIHAKYKSKGFPCRANAQVFKCIPYKEKEEPKTKRVAVIWFGDVPECTDYVDIRARQHGNEWDKGKEFKVELIDGDLVSESFGGQVDGGLCKIYKVIDPPAKPETVEEVWKRAPNRVSASYNMLANFIDDLEAAQDRAQDKKEG